MDILHGTLMLALWAGKWKTNMYMWHTCMYCMYMEHSVMEKMWGCLAEDSKLEIE